jgi:hypothetical protein
MPISITKNPRFQCTHTRSISDAECHHLSFSESELTKMLYKMISTQARVVMNADDLSDISELDSRVALHSEHGQRIEGLQEDKRRLYERLILGVLDVDGYKAENARLDIEVSRLTKIYDTLSAELESMTKGRVQAVERRKLAATVRAEKKLTRALVDLLIEKVLIFPGERVEVQWKFAAFFDVKRGGRRNAG